MKLNYLLGILLWTTGRVVAQEPDKEFQEFLNEIGHDFSESVASYQMNYDTFLQRTNKEYLDFIHKSEKEFIDLLPGSFQEYPKEESVVQEGILKPTHIQELKPVAPSIITLTERQLAIATYQESELVTPAFLPDNQLAQTMDSVVVKFLDHAFQITFDARLRIFSGDVIIDPNHLKLYLDTLLQLNYYGIIVQLNDIKSTMNLNDWDYFCLVSNFSQSFSDHENVQHIMAWFLMLESNYKVKIGFFRNRTCLLFAAQQPVYQMPWFNLNNVRYYTKECNADSISTYNIDYFKSYKYLNLFHDKPLLIGENTKSKTIRFPYNGALFQVDIHYNQRYVDYYSGYPQIPIDYYFTRPVSATFKESVDSAIAPLLYYKNQKERLNLLLSLVQYGFSYATDQEQFKRERYMSPEELLFYNASDCDDRTILFTYLVNELMHDRIIALDFYGHICSAVEVTDSDLEGNLVYKGKRYIACDPTYAGAPAGIIMPPYQSRNASIIDFNMWLNDFQRAERIWLAANKKGIVQADNGENMFVTADGSVLITGIMKEDSSGLNSGDNNTISKTSSFVALFNAADEIEWIRQIGGSGENYGYAVFPADQQNFYLFGYFRDSLKLDHFTIRAQDSGSFYLARMRITGETGWLRKINLPHLDPLISGITVVLDSAGVLRYYMPNQHYPPDKNYIIQTDENGYCYLYAMLPINASGLSENRRFSAGGDFDIISYLVNENNNLVKQNYPRSVSLLFSIIQYLRQNGSQINGPDLQKTITNVYTGDYSNKTELEQSLEDISEIRNANGITLIRTVDRNPVRYNTLQAEHESRLKLGYVNGNARIEVLNGVSMNHGSAWEKLNYIILDKTSGKILYDYDNHYRKKMPVYAELLN